jgi:hypothetical protein
MTCCGGEHISGDRGALYARPGRELFFSPALNRVSAVVGLLTGETVFRGFV